MISDPTLEFQFMAAAVRASIDQALMARMAAARNVVVDDNYVLTMSSDQLDQSIAQVRIQAISTKELKADATEAEFQDFFKKQMNMTTAEFKEQSLQRIKDALANPAERSGAINAFVQTALEQNFANTTQVTDEEVKKSYTFMSYQTIAFDKQEMGVAERQAAAAKAMSELQAGADFLAVQKKYMAAPSTEPVQYNQIVIENDPVLKPLAALKVGQFSEPIVEWGAIPRIYKLTKIESKLPDDFASNKAVYSEGFRREKARKVMNDELTEARKKAKIDWKSPGYEAIYKVLMVNMDGTLQPAQVKTKLREIVEETVVDPSDPAGTRPATYARYTAMQSLDFQFSDAEKKEFAPKKIEILNDMLVDTEHVPFRLELVDTYLTLGDNAQAAQELLAAATNNSGLEMINQTYFESINQKLTAMEAAKQIDAKKAEEVRGVLLQWSKDKAEADRLQEEQQKELDKFTIPDPAAEAAKKALEEANKPKTTTTTGGN
jgi:hypothetical protein